MKLIRSRSYYTKAKKRLKNLAKVDVLDWADEAGNQLARNLNDYRKSHDAAQLEQVYQSLQVLVAAVDILKERA